MSEKSVLFEPIPTSVSTQIQKRQEKHGATTRDKQTLVYLNSNTGWVRLRSGVNVLEDSEAKSYYKSGGNPPSGTATLARSMVLTGGTLNYNENPNMGAERPRGGVQFGEKTSAITGAYHNSPTTGFRPMPGIMGCSIISKGQYGVLREANIQIKVFSKEDLDDIEKLFFRLGYTALLEWGHSVFVSNEGKIEMADKSLYVSNGIWFGYNNDSSVISTLKSNKDNASNNYEAMYGRIKNFTWRLSSDGSYDCEVTLISKGVIVEGLAVGKPDDGAEPTEFKTQGVEETLEENRSIFHYIFTKLKRKKEYKEISIKEELQDKDGKALKVSNYFPSSDKGFRLSYSIGAGKNMFTKFLLNNNISPVLMPLRSFLRIINEIGIPKKSDKGQLVKFDLEAENKYRTFSQHFTLDPTVLILPKIPSGQDVPSEFYVTQKNYPGAMNDMVNFANSNGGKDNILNILLSTEYLMGQVEAIVDGPTEEGTGILDLIKGILATMKDVMGNINDFYVHYDEDTSLYSIVDDFGPKSKSPTGIKISGLSSTILDISAETKIDGRMQSAISIATQGTLTNYSDPLSHLIRFNQGCRDRHQPSAAIGDETPPTTDSIKKKNVELFKRYEEAWQDFNKKDVINPEVWAQLKAQGQALSNFYAAQGEKDSGPPMCVPVYINITMKGISGFAIGYVFTLDTDLLPAVYDNFGYVVRGVEHNIDSTGQWTTTITASMYSLSA